MDKLTQQVQSDQEIHKTLRERIAELEGILNAAPKPDMGLGGKERESVLRLIIGMAKGATDMIRRKGAAKWLRLSRPILRWQEYSFRTTQSVSG